MELDSLFAVTERQALEFFFVNLVDERVPDGANHHEIKYVASVLAHYSLVSTESSNAMPVCATLGQFHDQHVLPMFQSIGSLALQDASILETLGAQLIVLAGFLRDQGEHRHNVNYFVQLGYRYYDSAARLETESRRREVFERISAHYPGWINTCQRMSRNLRDQRYLLR